MSKEIGLTTFTYTNYKGHTSLRQVIPCDRWWGVTPYHQTPGWLMRGWDVEKRAWRTFAEKDIHEQNRQP